MLLVLLVVMVVVGAMVGGVWRTCSADGGHGEESSTGRETRCNGGGRGGDWEVYVGSCLGSRMGMEWWVHAYVIGAEAGGVRWETPREMPGFVW